MTYIGSDSYVGQSLQSVGSDFLKNDCQTGSEQWFGLSLCVFCTALIWGCKVGTKLTNKVLRYHTSWPTVGTFDHNCTLPVYSLTPANLDYSQPQHPLDLVLYVEGFAWMFRLILAFPKKLIDT